MGKIFYREWPAALLLSSLMIVITVNQHAQSQKTPDQRRLNLSVETAKPSIGPDHLRQERTDIEPVYQRATKSAGPPSDQILATGTSFDAFYFDDNATENLGYTFIPPDPIGAAGLDRLIAVVNVMIEARDKSGTLLWRDALSDFFFPLSPVNFTFDPKVVYDHYEDRFVVVTLERVNTGSNPDAGNTSRILVAVSKSAAPATATSADWYYHAINAEESIGSPTAFDHWVDYPGFELDEEAVYITGNMFAHEGGSTTFSVRLWIIDKGVSGGFYNGGTAVVTKHDPYVGGGIATTTMPALVYGFGGAGIGIGTYLVSFSGLSGGGFEFIQVVRVDDPLSSPTFNHEYINIGNIDNLSSGLPDAPQSGTDTLIEVNDRRALDAVWRNDRLWLTTTIIPNSEPNAGETTAHWVRLNTSSVPSGLITYDDQGNIGGEDIDISGEVYTFFPSLAVNNAGDAYFGFSASSSNIFAGAYCAGRKASDPPGTIQATETVRAGVDHYVRTFGTYPLDKNRWGDYSGAALDPTDDNLFWIFNEYAMTRSGSPPDNGRWATAWASVSFVQTIFTNGADIALNFNQTNPSPPQSDWPLGQFSLSGSSNGAVINALTVILSGSYSNLDGPQPFRLFAANTNNFSGASAIGSDAAASSGSVTFSGLADALPSGSRYYWVTADLATGASGNINGSITYPTDFNLAGGSLSPSSVYGALNSGFDVSLPVQLSTFSADAEDGQIILHWITQSEIANLGFIIRRATEFEGPYTELASYADNEKLKGQGNTADSTAYEFSDDRVENGRNYFYTLTDVDFGGKRTTHGPVEVTASGAELTTHQYHLSQNYPNPFNPSTKIKFQIPNSEFTTLKIYNVLGKEVATLVSDNLQADRHHYQFDGSKLASGIYYYQIIAGEFRDVKKMILLR